MPSKCFSLSFLFPVDSLFTGFEDEEDDLLEGDVVDADEDDELEPLLVLPQAVRDKISNAEKIRMINFFIVNIPHIFP